MFHFQAEVVLQSTSCSFTKNASPLEVGVALSDEPVTFLLSVDPCPADVRSKYAHQKKKQPTNLFCNKAFFHKEDRCCYSEV
jgi:hypothetical protein